MYPKVVVKSWVGVSGDCPISYNADTDGDGVDFMFGNQPDHFEFGFDTEALREFLRVGTDALREMDARLVSEQD
jgi:hypothetical protein